MDHLGYAEFLSSKYRTGIAIEPRSSWWEWRGRDVHLLRAVVDDAPVRMVVIHGAGGHAAMLWPFAAAVASEGVDVTALDLPLYGRTVEPNPATVRYADWVDLLCDFVHTQTAIDDRPLVLFGASMGGLLAYEVAARTDAVAYVVVTCLLDPADPQARAAAMRCAAAGRYAPQLLGVTDTLFGRVRVPIRWLVKMDKMSRDPKLSKRCAEDPVGGGVSVPLGFLASFVAYPTTPPEEFATPITLVHPAADEWTPPVLSERFLARIPGRTEMILLEGCGHFPVEEPGVGQLADALRAVRARVIESIQ
ncbi:alpha/beta hydrolase [Nocardia puris]|uniref:Alpha-beta hydrolase superfamily lysophospholipase n=1 Tax=Nocardia puris TaxID=208602 RepID=A0A366E3V7_9NOCA|nr:alpha/beta hydrolase [Nocardia puris]MBF6214412.1 alpha/beta hydrolase [Nocardia puris]MBF6369027.1 alpha/beta hydrolase [Nocardia puris]MBF6462825.1 alpha/beta hydrolase [Nocardia puris]RBO96795.1 alpha-beta hydrolase superfamily lysophospholipase [Nocardia puris]